MTRFIVHPDRYSLTGVALRKRLLVVHTSEGGELSTSDEVLMTLMGQPGDRDFDPPDPAGRKYGAAYHAVADGDNETYHEATDAARLGVYGAAGVNKWASHIVHPGRVSQTRDQWLDPRSRGQIKGVAHYFVDQAALHDIELRWLSVAEVQATADPSSGVTGYCGHHDVSLAFNRTTHTDPDPNYPRDVLALDIASIVTPPPMPPEEDMKRVQVQAEGHVARFLGWVDPATGRVDSQLEWTGAGGSPEVAARIAGLEVVTVPFASLAFRTLLGPLPYGEAYEWTGGEFYRVID